MAKASGIRRQKAWHHLTLWIGSVWEKAFDTKCMVLQYELLGDLTQVLARRSCFRPHIISKANHCRGRSQNHFHSSIKLGLTVKAYLFQALVMSSWIALYLVESKTTHYVAEYLDHKFLGTPRQQELGELF